MATARRHWLMKCEPSSYTIDDLERDGTTSWEGVRNYQARNFMRDDMRIGDRVLFYASNAEPSGVTGIAEVCREGYVDHFQFASEHDYFDPKATEAKPIWYMVDIRFIEKFASMVEIAALRETPGLENMMVLQRGSRLSVQPVTKQEFDVVVRLGRRKTAASR